MSAHVQKLDVDADAEPEREPRQPIRSRVVPAANNQRLRRFGNEASSSGAAASEPCPHDHHEIGVVERSVEIAFDSRGLRRFDDGP